MEGPWAWNRGTPRQALNLPSLHIPFQSPLSRAQGRTLYPSTVWSNSSSRSTQAFLSGTPIGEDTDTDWSWQGHGGTNL